MILELTPLGEVTPTERVELAWLLRVLRPRELFESDDEHLGACLAVLVQGHVTIGRTDVGGIGMTVRGDEP
jgi:hypothetical protein